MPQISNHDTGNKGVHDLPLDPWPGRDRHVQQVAPGRHPATVTKTNKHTKLGTWNVRTLFQSGKLENVEQEMDRIGFNILGMSETRWTGQGLIKVGDKTMIYSGGQKHERGVGMLFESQIVKSIKGWWGVSDRVIVAKLQGKPLDIGIVQVYAPTSSHCEEEVEKFYEDLNTALKQLKSQDVKVIMGDFNAKVGCVREGNIVGPWGLGDINERDEQLIEWCKEKDFGITNTWFQQHERRRYTWISPGDMFRNQIDFILVQNRFRNAVKSAKSIPGADCDSDHVPVMCKLQIRLRALKKTMSKPNYHVEFLKTNDVLREKFTIDISNRFKVLDEVTESDEMWDKMKNSINEAMKENIPIKTRKHDKKWITPDILELMDTRRKEKANVGKFKTLTKEIKRMCSEAKEKWINDQCGELERKQNSDSRIAHEKIREVSGKKSCSSTGCIRSKTGEILIEKQMILGRWSEYIGDLYEDDERGDIPKIKRNMDGPPILKSEVEAAIKKMKSGKATGPDNIPIEIVTSLEEIGINKTTTLLNSIYSSGNLPEDLKESVFVTLPKTPGATECASHRTISLMSHFTKLLLRILMWRMRKHTRVEISKTQFGFVKDKGTRNAIFTLSMLMERCIEMRQDLYICFIDYSKAFDKVKHDKLFNLLTELDIDGKDLRIIRNLYWDQNATVRVDGEFSQPTKIKRGVRQGCVLSPDLFNLYSENILRNLDDLNGIKVNGENINNIRYADDTALIAGSQEDLQKLLNTVVAESERMGLSLNVKKTECMVVSKKSVIPICKIKSQGEEIKQVEKFKYLGYVLTSDGRCDTEIKKRIAIAKDSFSKMKPILSNLNITMDTKLRLLKAYVWSTLLYGCESWTISESVNKKLEAAEMWFLRRMLRISWKEKKSNETVLQQSGIRRSLIKTIRRRQLEFLGHINRGRGLEHLALTGRINGTRDRGCQRLTYLSTLNCWATQKQQTNIEFLRVSDDRDAWRSMITDVCLRPGT